MSSLGTNENDEPEETEEVRDSWHSRALGEDLTLSLGGRIRHAREFRGFTQKECGEMFKVSKRQYMRYENDQTPPSLAKIEHIADAFNVSRDWLIRGVGNMSSFGKLVQEDLHVSSSWSVKVGNSSATLMATSRGILVKPGNRCQVSVSYASGDMIIELKRS